MVKATIPGASLPLLRVVIAGNHSASMPLGSIKDDLTTLLNHHTLSQIQVEVINGDHFYVPTLFPIQSTAELAVAFHHLKDDIVWLLDEALGTKWQLVSPFNVGKDSRSARPALVVGVLPSTKANCHQLQPSSPNVSTCVTHPSYFCRHRVPPWETQPPRGR